MNWFRGNRDQQNDQNNNNNDNNAPTAAPDADELRRRRLAKLQEAQTEAARRKDFEERKAQWEASKKAKATTASSSSAVPTEQQTTSHSSSVNVSHTNDTMVQKSATITKTTPEKPQSGQQPPTKKVATSQPSSSKPSSSTPDVKQSPKRAQQSLPSLEIMTSRVISRIFCLAHTSQSSSNEAIYYPDLISNLRRDSGISDNDTLIINCDSHPDDIILNRINSDSNPLNFLLTSYSRCSQQLNDVNSNRKLQVNEQEEKRTKLIDSIRSIENRIFTYTGMLLSGSFMEIESANPQAFAEYLLNEKLPAGFIRSLLNHHSNPDNASSLDDILPVFRSVFIYIRSRAKSDSKLSSSSFLKPLNALASLVSHKELCRLLTSMPDFVPQDEPNRKLILAQFAFKSYLYPFFQISALPGAPLGQIPMFPEDPSIATSMFPNPSMLDSAEADGAIYSLRASLSVARNLLSRVCLAICKAGIEPRNAVLSWFAKVFNMNQKRTAMQPNPSSTSRDGFMLNIMYVLLKLCDPIISGGWRMLQKVDPTYPQSSHRIDYSDETRLAADTDMLKRWWVDKRNQNAQESLTRQLEVAARESGLHSSSSNSNVASSSNNNNENNESNEENTKPESIGIDFNFVTECFWMALRGVQLGFIPVMNVYREEILRTLQRIRDVVKAMEAEKERGTLPPDQEMQLNAIKRRFDSLFQAKLCYDVYVLDPELIRMLICFVTADAEWIMKKLLAKGDGQEVVLPLPLPVDKTFASLPEHSVETITAVLLTAMNTDSRIVMEHYSLLEEMVSFCVVGSASPLHIKNPYLRAKLVEFLSMIFPRNAAALADDGDENERNSQQSQPAMEALFGSHQLSKKFLPGSLFRLYVDVEHTGSHTQFYDKFTIRYRIGTIIESLWYLPDYRKSVQNEAKDETRFLRFVNMVLNDANHLLDSVLDDLEEMHTLEIAMQNKQEWDLLSDDEKREKQDHLQKLQGAAKSHNLLANNNVKLLWLLTGDSVVKRIFLRDEMVSRLAQMLNYLLGRLCGQRCSELKVSNPDIVSWKPRLLLKRIMETYTHFLGEDVFMVAVARDGRSYKNDLFIRAIAIVKNRRLMRPIGISSFEQVAAAAAKAHDAENEEEEDLGEIPDEFLDPIMSVLMKNPVRLPTSGNVVDRAVISRILLSDKVDPFNRKLLTEDMLEEDVDLKNRIDEFIKERRTKDSTAS